jgi:3-hydroxyacyl-CoA dehydrogenase, NAD binding domain/SMP-30/Gluconolactonase/LRE-like region
MRPAAALEAALDGAAHVQENRPEDVEVKRKVFAQLDAAAAPDAVLASSTSAILPSAFTETLKGRARCLVVHPINPPYLISAAEVVPAPWTDAETVERAASLLRSAGHAPIMMKREIDGFVMNRLQGRCSKRRFALWPKVKRASRISTSDSVMALRCAGCSSLFVSDSIRHPGGIGPHPEGGTPGHRRPRALRRQPRRSARNPATQGRRQGRFLTPSVRENPLMLRIELLIDARAELGEGPLWDVAEQRLYWIDSLGAKVHSCDADGGAARTWDVPEHIGSLALM